MVLVSRAEQNIPSGTDDRSRFTIGEGVSQDFVQAHKWYNLGGANGEELGVKHRDDLAKQMTSAQITEAQKLAREWEPKGRGATTNALTANPCPSKKPPSPTCGRSE